MSTYFVCYYNGWVTSRAALKKVMLFVNYNRHEKKFFLSRAQFYYPIRHRLFHVPRMLEKNNSHNCCGKPWWGVNYVPCVANPVACGHWLNTDMIDTPCPIRLTVISMGYVICLVLERPYEYVNPDENFWPLAVDSHPNRAKTLCTTTALKSPP